MKKWINVVAIALAMLLGTYALAADPAPDGAKPVRGKVSAIAKDSADSKITDITITSRGKDGAAGTDTVIKADDSTKVTKGTDPATLADVTVGTGVTVTVGADNKATTITIRAARTKKPAN